jgi:adenosylcobinamide-GDP ribazoletransferase
MSVADCLTALRFLTRLPVPGKAAAGPGDLARAAAWFPLAGVIIGLTVAGALWAGAHASPSIGALLALLVWVGITGGLHLDGLADVADALAASHRSPERFLAVLRDPHIGAFGAIAIGLQLIAKLVLLADLPVAIALPGLILIPAWARWGALVWALLLRPLAPGSGSAFAAGINRFVVAGEAIVLAIISACFAPWLVLAPLVVIAIGVCWKMRLGGMTGDCLGASIEITETALLFVLALTLA